MMDIRLLKRLDWTLLAAVLLLCLYGLLMIYSATRAPNASGFAPPSDFVRKQSLWLLIGLAAFILTIFFDYEKIARWHIPIYALTLLLLVLVLSIGRAPTGAVSWIAIGSFRLQPSEFAKIAVILSLAAFLSSRIGAIHRPRVLLLSLLIPAVPVLLVILQPDFGTALVIIAIWFGALYLVGARARQLAAVFTCGLLLFTAMWYLDRLPLERIRPAALGRALAHTGLKDYQKRRLTIFLNPQADPLGAGYHIIQSRLTIGSGQLLGRGLFHGTQSRLRFIPERHTDFIFSVVGEELGLLGALAMLLLYFFIFWRGLRIALRARDHLGSLLAAGAISMLIFHAIINLGMSVGLMPVTGLPLPFVSYGGSNLLTSSIAFGLLQNVHMRRQKLMF
ncbi:MAG: rod shape-determining protein RodA [Armatimonadota bacterium]|nr:MAG: rod shape-determining protein RodA [Armatimonadota bacterium]